METLYIQCLRPLLGRVLRGPPHHSSLPRLGHRKNARSNCYGSYELSGDGL
jgi:hypothetical protein